MHKVCAEQAIFHGINKAPASHARESPFGPFVSCSFANATQWTVNDYDSIADVFDEVMAKDFHAATHEIRRRVIDQHFDGRELHCLDACCGTGVFFERLGSVYPIRGFGIDLSVHQIEIARARSHSNPTPTTYEVGDVTLVPFRDNLDLVTINLDALNHLRSAALWRQTFTKAYRALKQGGILLFDINLPERLLVDWNAPELIIKDGVAYIQVALPPTSNVDGITRRTHVVVFKQGDTGAFQRRDTVIEQLAMPIDKVLSLLSDCGFQDTHIVESSANEPKGHIFNKNRRVGFVIPSGEVWGLIGRSGIGKTTLLNVILGLFSPDTGSVATALGQIDSPGRIRGVWHLMRCL